MSQTREKSACETSKIIDKEKCPVTRKYEQREQPGLESVPTQQTLEPVAYRDKDGIIKVYGEGTAPFYWVRDGGVRAKDFETTNHQATTRHTRSPTESVTSQVSGTGESYTEYQRSETHTSVPASEEIEVPVSPVPEVVLPRRRRRDVMPDDFTLGEIDAHAIKAPTFIKENLTELVKYLTSVAKTPVETIRAFYVWITHNINYDTSGYFGRAQLKPTVAEAVLKTRLTVCEGYCNVFEAFCREIGIPVKTISGYAKAYGYKPGYDVTADAHNAHAWNAVFLEAEWFLLDVTWGAGFVKAKEKKYVAKFNNAYFLTDPEVFLTDHFPAPVKGYAHCESGPEWQLVDDKLSKEEFCNIVNFDKQGKDWDIKPATHTRAVIENIEYELDIVLQSTSTNMLDYIAFLYADERKLDQFTYTYMLGDTKVNIHVCLPGPGDFSLQIFGRSKQDGPRSDYQPIVRYILRCDKAYETPIPYPTHHTVYGPVADLQSYGVSEVGDIFQEAEEGELILTVKPTRYIDILPKLRYGDQTIDLKDYCFVDFSDGFMFMNVILRLRYEGYYKLELLAKGANSTALSPFVTYIVKCTKSCTDGVFPVANEYALKYKCSILEPLSKRLPSKTGIFICIKSPVVTKIKCSGSEIEKVDDVTFEGTIETPEEDCKFSIDGCANDGVFHPLYTYNTVLYANET